MREALVLAEEAARDGEVPVGALVVHDSGTVVSRARNEVEESHDATAHAELLALRRASQHFGRWRLSDCTLYVTLEPCPMCAGALRLARLKRIVFGATDPRMGAFGSLVELSQTAHLGPPIETSSGILAEECGAILKEFFQERRKAKE